MNHSRILNAVVCARLFKDMQKQAEAGKLLTAAGNLVLKGQDLVQNAKDKAKPVVDKIWNTGKELLTPAKPSTVPEKFEGMDRTPIPHGVNMPKATK